MIHEGTHGIQALDLLGRKVLMEEGRAMRLLSERMHQTIAIAAQWPDLESDAKSLSQALQKVVTTTQQAWSTGQAHEALANAVPYLQAFGHLVIAWMWLDVNARCRGESCAAQVGRLAASQYFFRYELPKIDAWLSVVSHRDLTCANLDEASF
jgi:butyryl-CoA dehydrogenase